MSKIKTNVQKCDFLLLDNRRPKRRIYYLQKVEFKENSKFDSGKQYCTTTVVSEPPESEHITEFFAH